MTPARRIEIQFERRLLEHPAGYHVRRMRLALWLYLDLLARLPAGQDALEVDPVEIALDMGLPEGTVRSWLGHLRRMQYLRIERLGGQVRIRVGRLGLPEPPPAPKPKFFTVRKLERALGERDEASRLAEAVRYPDDLIQRALAGALAVPDDRIRKSRIALFLFLLKRYATPHATTPRH